MPRNGADLRLVCGGRCAWGWAVGSWETAGASDEWFTPAHVFDAMAVRFDMDVAAPEGGAPFVPCGRYLTRADDGLVAPWQGFVWMNPPFGGRNGLAPWLDRFFHHGNGVALVPDRTSAPWWQDAARWADGVLFTRGKVKFIRPDGSVGKSPGAGVTLFAAGDFGRLALRHAAINGLGFYCRGVDAWV